MRAIVFSTSLLAGIVACSSFGTDDPATPPAPPLDGGADVSAVDAQLAPDGAAADAPPPTKCAGEFSVIGAVPWATGHASLRFGVTGSFTAYNDEAKANSYNLDFWDSNNQNANIVVAGLNNTQFQGEPSPLDNDLALIFEQNIPSQKETLVIAHRIALNAPFVSATPLVFNSSASEPSYAGPYVVGDHIYYRYGDATTAHRIRMGQLDSQRKEVQSSIDVLSDNPRPHSHPVVTKDERTLFYASGIPPGSADTRRIWMAKKDAAGAFVSSALAGAVNAKGDETWPTSISDDECTLYYVRRDAEFTSLWRATRLP